MDGYTILKNLINEAQNLNSREEQLALLDKIFKHLWVVLFNNDLIIFYNLLKALLRNTNSFNQLEEKEIITKYRENNFDYVSEFKSVLKKAALNNNPKKQKQILRDILSLFPEDIESKYQYIDKEIFDEIRTILFRNLSLFNTLTEDEISSIIIQPDSIYKNLIPNFNVLEDIDAKFYPSIIKCYCRSNHVIEIIENYHLITSKLKINPLDLAFYMLTENDSAAGFIISNSIETFDSKYHPDIADLLIDSKNSIWLIDEIERFEGIDHNDILNKILDSNINDEDLKSIVSILYKLRDLKIDSVLKIVKRGYLEDVITNLLNNRPSFNPEVIDYLKKNKDKNLIYKSHYVSEILKYPSLISDICS